MASSMLAAIREATLADADTVLDEDETRRAGASSTQEDGAMSKDDTPAGGAKNAGISQAEHDAAVAASRAEGKDEGAREATSRLVTALGAEGVKGDPGRMSAALDLAEKSPGMSGEDVAAFVTANVAAAAGQKPAADYETKRLAAAGLAQPGPRREPGADRSVLSAAVERTNKRR
ncbi:hypothetical protein GRZ55_11230 [Chelativorans sp. ZYF759]|uniref:hypothetical protein n=1 Tax=Chelativorans sp. ZYF759 TaxID=2692213 RepID=UPI00145D0465|nr:hypothetical protein [Chelativorans sp. ZYF759]NMG39816.1 hypothetical protein [Chelativorans sp. ZYF759]